MGKNCGQKEELRYSSSIETVLEEENEVPTSQKPHCVSITNDTKHINTLCAKCIVFGMLNQVVHIVTTSV
jgi:hypothetical protein